MSVHEAKRPMRNVSECLPGEAFQWCYAWRRLSLADMLLADWMTEGKDVTILTEGRQPWSHPAQP